jgi:phage FluMu protein Com
VKYGKELGNLELGKVETGETLWLDKKFYYINDKCMRCKGISEKTIDEHGNDGTTCSS